MAGSIIYVPKVGETDEEVEYQFVVRGYPETYTMWINKATNEVEYQKAANPSEVQLAWAAIYKRQGRPTPGTIRTNWPETATHVG